MKNLLFYFLCSQFLICQIPQDKKIISSLYVYDLDSKKSTLLFKEERHFEAPNWSKDGNYLYINSQGKLEKYDLKGNNLGVINTGNLDKLNNDHGISFDGKILFFSSGKNEIQGHSSYIYSIPLAGGTPKLLTKFSPSYWHGVSADGKYIVYCAERDGNYDVYKLNSEGGVEVRLTFDDGLDDGPEYSPDGKYIYFNSYRSGKMQIWRMNSKGSDAEQITFDKYSNWFPHISPKNDLAVIIPPIFALIKVSSRASSRSSTSCLDRSNPSVAFSSPRLAFSNPSVAFSNPSMVFFRAISPRLYCNCRTSICERVDEPCSNNVSSSLSLRIMSFKFAS